MAFSSEGGLEGGWEGGLEGALGASEFWGAGSGRLLGELSQRVRQAVRAVWQLTTHPSPGAGGASFAGVAIDGGGAYTSVGAGVATSVGAGVAM